MQAAAVGQGRVDERRAHLYVRNLTDVAGAPKERPGRERKARRPGLDPLTRRGPMATISVITPPSEPGVFQLYAVGLDVSAAYVAGVSQATWWLSTEEARQLCHDLGTKLLPTVEGGTE
jgi:hypothetical protein